MAHSAALVPLLNAWRRLQLAAAAPGRIAGWDVVCLTASNPAQAVLYRQALADLTRRGLLPPGTGTVVVEDPGGARIGSGGATLNALRRLAADHADVADRRVLLIHAGGDSRRLPWASVLGKVFVPVPLLADPDHPCPSLLEHLLAVASPVPASMPGGGLLCLTGDVLPLVDLAHLTWPAESLAVVATPAPLAVAGKHGVIVCDAAGEVSDLLQKASPAALEAGGAVLPDGGALIDTGIWWCAGAAFRALTTLATDPVDPVAQILADGREVSLYEEIPAACLKPKLAWLAGRPLGARLGAALGATRLGAVIAPDLRFLHLGTSTEYLDHLDRPWDGERATRLLAEAGTGADPESIVIASALADSTRVGRGSMVAWSCLGASASIGARSIVIGVQAPSEPLLVPDHHALWQAAVKTSAGPGWVTAWCGIDDNPKDALDQATFGNRPLRAWLDQHRIDPTDVWPDGTERILWHARLFPVTPVPSLGATAWMLGNGGTGTAGEAAWRAAQRLSLAQVSALADPQPAMAARTALTDRLLTSALARVAALAADRDAGALASGLSDAARPALAALADAIPAAMPVALHRRRRLQNDLCRAAGLPVDESAPWRAVAESVAATGATVAGPAPAITPGTNARADMPARIDLAGGWSDTPPYCLERPGRVLNLAIRINGDLPIGAEAMGSVGQGVELRLDGRPSVQVPWADLDPQRRFALDDPYALLKTALVVCGFHAAAPVASGAVHLHAWSRLPKGSGLGGSSIVAAAIVRCLQRLTGRDDGPGTVGPLVLAVEQRLGTGGGWQDQYGGLVAGTKVLSCLPTTPLRVSIEPVPLGTAARALLHERLVLIDTGITRLARDVLQRVMGRWLAREAGAVRGLTRLADLATDGRDALASGRLDDLARIIGEVWAIHQRLDPMCSNPEVDALFTRIAPHALGWKLCGAGGGGFAVALARDAQSAKALVAALPEPARAVAWSLT